jgi:hypothetical protein
VRMIRWLSARGVGCGDRGEREASALMAATVTEPGVFCGPTWPGNAGGPPGVQELWKPLRDSTSAARMWEKSEELTGVTFG